jgi:hypothetical protein
MVETTWETEGRIKTDLKEMECEDVYWMYLGLHRV